jgi:hypothetical protein
MESFHWSPAERFVSGSPPQLGAIPSVDFQSVHCSQATSPVDHEPRDDRKRRKIPNII